MKNLSINQKIKKQKIIALMFFTLSFFTLQKTNAAPGIETVSGNLTKNANVIVEGSAFGTKEVAAPFYFNTMENETVGQMPADQVTNISKSMFVSNQKAYNGSKSEQIDYCSDAAVNKLWTATGYYDPGYFVVYNSKHYRCLNTVHSTISPDLDSVNWIEDENLPSPHCTNGKTQSDWGRSVVYLGPDGANSVYGTMWIYLDKKTSTSSGWQWKGPLDIVSKTDSNGTVYPGTWYYDSSCSYPGPYPNVQCYQESDVHTSFWWSELDQVIFNIRGLIYAYDDSIGEKHPHTQYATYVDNKDAFLWNQWQRVEWYAQRSSIPGTADGIWREQRIGKNGYNFNTTTAITNLPGNDPWQYVALTHALESVYDGYVDFTVNYDDIYIDKTQARIELCDTQTWESRTHCEIQIPTSWNNSQIQFTLNQGSFPNGRAYLFVIDENGIPSTGKEINLGQTSTPTSFNISNFTTLLSNWLKKESNNAADLNSDGIINSRDLGIMMGKWN